MKFCKKLGELKKKPKAKKKMDLHPPGGFYAMAVSHFDGHGWGNAQNQRRELFFAE